MTKTYVTIQGDTWDSIAYKEYGAETGMATLLEANPEVSHLAIFPAGVVLQVPEYDKPQANRLPPWRR